MPVKIQILRTLGNSPLLPGDRESWRSQHMDLVGKLMESVISLSPTSRLTSFWSACAP